MKKLLGLFLLFILTGAGSLMAQRTINGTVYDAQSQDPLPGVNIAVVGTTQGTTTDADGNYALTVPQDARTLQFSFVGYKAARVEIGSQTTINVFLEMEVGQFDDEIVVTAFGIGQRKRSLGYSAQSVDGGDIQASQESDILSALQGKVPGVQIGNSGGAVGGGSSIMIRGITSLNPGANNQPLFVIDGVPISNDTQSSNILPSTGSNAFNSAQQMSFTNRGADINPDDIESINILKGPAATALYGLRAANGVVVITTKQGGAGATAINFKSTVGFSQANKFPGLQDSYREGRFGMVRFNSDGSPNRFQTFGPPRTDDPFYNNYKNFFQTGTDVKNYLSISGGNEQATFFTSVSHNNLVGIVPNTDYTTTTATLRGTIRFGERLTMNGSAQFTNSGGNRPIGGDKSIMSSLSYQSPTFDVNEYIDSNGNPINYAPGIIDNPRYEVELKKFKDDVNRIFGHVGFSYQLLDWLTLDYKFGLDNYSDNRVRIVPPGLDVSASVNGFVVHSELNHSEINSDAILTADRALTEDLRLTLKVGNNINQRKNAETMVRGEGYTIPGFDDISNTQNFYPFRDSNLSRIVGVFGDAQFDYDNQLFLTITGRNDWSSTLPENNRSFFYPSVSLGYVFSEMLNLDNSLFNYGKLRASWAQVGKDASAYQIGRYYVQANGFPFGSVNGFVRSPVAGSENLKPEKTTSVELGANFRFFDNRLELDASVYRSLSDNQIFEIPLSNSSGLSRLISNAGEIENKGVEVLILGTPVQTRSFRWDMSLNWTTMRGVVKSMPEGIDEITFYSDNITNKLVVGGDVGDLYGYDFYRAGVGDNPRCPGNGELCITNDGFPSINLDKQVKVGNAFPKWEAGITNNLAYKNLSLSFLVEIKQGGDKFDMGLRNAIRNGIAPQTELRYKEVIFKGVKSDGSVNTTPVVINGENFYRDAARYNTAAEVILQDASWVRLRRISLSYQLPASVVEALPLKSADLSVTGNNLFLITPFQGYDPEANQFGSGSNIYGYTGLTIPSTRSLIFSVNLSF